MLPLKKIDGEKKEITLGICSYYPLLTGASFRKWNALNVLEELDLPGEYVLDQEKKKLYVYPFQDNPSLVEISVMGDPLKGWSKDAPVFKKYPDFPRIPLEKIGAKLPVEK